MCELTNSMISPRIVESVMKRAARGIARCVLLAGAIVVLGAPSASPAGALHWIGTWATAAQPAQAARAQTFRNQNRTPDRAYQRRREEV
jgi:hypothetical protein